MTAIKLINILKECPPNTPIYMACLDDDSGQGDYPLSESAVDVRPLQNGILGGPAGDCVAIAYRSGSGGKANLN